MASNYEAIYEENRKSYGTKGAQKSGRLAAGLYDDRTHFIFELLQNAEDALGKRDEWHGSHKVSFTLNPTHLMFSHFGKPFDEADVRSICDINESTKNESSIGRFGLESPPTRLSPSGIAKNESSIGRFGLGFKSVYTITGRPEIHSGDEDFAIEEYVFPKRSERSAREADETQIVLPLKSGDDTAQQEITTGFRRLGPDTLLFLRHIEEINWNVEGGTSGFYLRNSPEMLGDNVRRIMVIGQEDGKAEVDQNWLVFHREVFSDAQEKVGRVEIAFSLAAVKDAPGHWSVQPVATSPLVVFFPTVVPTNLGFLVQGPYRTTPSRDTILRDEPWNQHLVKETSSLLVEAMRWMRDKGMLDTSALRCLPLDRKKFPEEGMFAPIFDTVRHALLNEPLLPRFDGGFIPASQAKLARTQELRKLFSPEQIAALFGSEVSAWLTDGITQDRQPEIRSYLMKELRVAEETPETLVPLLNKTFLESQTDDWVKRLYEFLNAHSLDDDLDEIPLIRLDNGTHVVARDNGMSNAFLPSAIKTDFPTIRAAVCASDKARQFLIRLDISEPDPVDDVIRNLLWKYREETVDVADDDYAADTGRIRAAFCIDSKAQREKLLSELRKTSFVRVVDTGDGKGRVAKPGGIYIATDRLKQLFAGVPGIYIVDDRYDCLRGEEMRELLEACGALRYPRPEKAPAEPYYSDRLKELRVRAGHAETSGYSDTVEDWTLQGFQNLLDHLPKLSSEQRVERARLIWENLGDLKERCGHKIFDGSYTWSHNGKYTRSFPAAFLRILNTAAWVPDATGELVPPNLVVFDTLGWETNPFLLTKITFKPPIIDQLAKEAGIDPGILDLIRKHDITMADLISRFGITDQPPVDEAPADGAPSDTVPPDDKDDISSTGDDVYDGAKDLHGGDMPDIPLGTPEPDGGDSAIGGAERGSQGGTRWDATTWWWPHSGSGGKSSGIGSGGQGKRTPGSPGGRPFISYIGIHTDDEETDPDGLDQATRMRIEEQGIALIIELEPQLQRTPNGNPGFDLFEANDAGQQVRWVEVKSMTGSLENRPVGISRAQFDFARAKGDAFWLYVVEYATDPGKARVLRIRNPIAHARTFTFDHGWSQIAQLEPPTANQPKA